MPPDIDEVELATTLTELKSGQGVLRADIARYFAETQKLHDDHEERIRSLEREQTSLSVRVNTWGGINTIGAAIAGVVGWFRGG
jgi:hypothetical protein